MKQRTHVRFLYTLHKLCTCIHATIPLYPELKLPVAVEGEANALKLTGTKLTIMAASLEIVEGTRPGNLNFFQDRSRSFGSTSQASTKCKGHKV